ncbi:hypothetical protein [Bradyrhizobium sp. AUGA SZCCT0042]|uniref:hypothetical protein n=1 Tax=Bradyrhizobium sp. AUGA SZCCT0042 TaxID=2807651 RepID=UPI001BAD6D3C|nr:hypothetical protein [Bradyrhizobium sp. AUGA SZCCT0042]MBR1298558.1 hypothetical protein [Bradyrhizobium sp. AUGA SZCCT0042]
MFSQLASLQNTTTINAARADARRHHLALLEMLDQAWGRCRLGVLTFTEAAITISSQLVLDQSTPAHEDGNEDTTTTKANNHSEANMLYQDRKLTTPDAQEGTATAASIEVGNGATRYDWSIAFTRICMRKEYPAIAIAAAMRLVEELPRKQGKCAPHRDDMAAELGRDIRTMDRGYKVLEADGWITRKKGGRNDPVTITLLIPPEDADIHRFGNKAGVGKRDTSMSHLEVVQTRHETAPSATSNGFKRDIQRVASKEQEEQKEQSEAQPPRACVLADRPVSSPVTELDGESASAVAGLSVIDYQCLWREHPKYPDTYFEGDAQEVFDKLVEEGIDPEMLRASLADYRKRCDGADPKTIKLMCYWLRVRGWEEENYPKLNIRH